MTPRNTGRGGAGTKRGTTSAPLKNYRSSAGLADILDAIRRTLAEGGARRISFDYGAEGEAREITFCLPVGEQLATFRLPARLDSVQPLIIESYRTASRSIPRGEALKEQAEKTGWANIRDWLSAQVALIRTGMVKPQEVFLPYLLIEGYDRPLTYFEVFEQHRALPATEQRGRVSISLQED